MLQRFRLRKRIKFFSRGDLWFLGSLVLLAVLGISPWIWMRVRPVAAQVIAATTSQFSTGVTNNQYNEPPWIEISTDEHLLRLRTGINQILWEAPVAVGKSRTPTPKGQFEVIEMVEHPVWQDPFNPRIIYDEKNPRNPLGLRWIGFKQAGLNDYGLHGTTSISSIGRSVTNGCVRLRNEDIVFLYDQVEEGTPVVIH
ncbi:L,D-transpeptidase [Gloeobacter kilaueensis]|uniref:ErfK/YbiS/YcfS/YnhG family protein n=1 Tax=Gloeobacter kilaueensis (strain ATCC BAA-2537 / CCAP 1431/1 / ULC 316 / JS1) TaxID=1183438 RepID=U5QFG7_GLOK1|nr:L,D-transpeptidase [Gloeobacter kilaueensis]AGY57686.1 ErfK/YbiS/YcfS/YnhG family protein [Gloeobacter kilaueensis JS1]